MAGVFFVFSSGFDFLPVLEGKSDVVLGIDRGVVHQPVPSFQREFRQLIGYMPPVCLASNLVVVIANATMYHFGVLTSYVFMSWMRAVCGRLKSDYRITKDNVYNNFPWPNPTPKQKELI